MPVVKAVGVVRPQKFGPSFSYQVGPKLPTHRRASRIKKTLLLDFTLTDIEEKSPMMSKKMSMVDRLLGSGEDRVMFR